MFPFLQIILHTILHVLKQHNKEKDRATRSHSPHLAPEKAFLGSPQPTPRAKFLARSSNPHLKNKPKIGPAPRAAKTVGNRPKWSPHWPATSFSKSPQSVRARKVPVRSPHGAKKTRPDPALQDTVIPMDTDIEIPNDWHEIASKIIKTMVFYGFPSTYIFFLMGYMLFPMIYHIMY